MKRYYKPEVLKVTLSSKEQVLVHCKTSDGTQDPACWLTDGTPAKEHYHVIGTG